MDLKEEVDLVSYRRETLARLVKKLVCDEEINEHAGQASRAIAGLAQSLDSIVDAMLQARMPFALRTFDADTRFSNTKMRANFGAFAETAFRTLSTVFPADSRLLPEEPEVPEHAEELEEQTNVRREPGLGILGGNLGAWDTEEDIEEWTRAEVTRQVAADCERALLLVAATPVARKVTYILAGRLMELADLTPVPRSKSEDPDESRYERTKRAIYEANKRDGL